MKETTKRVYEFIRQHWHEHGIGPTHREIAAGCFMAQPSIIPHLEFLVAQNKIKREPGKARSIQLVDPQ